MHMFLYFAIESLTVESSGVESRFWEKQGSLFAVNHAIR